MLKYRLIFGTVMTLFFVSIVIFGSYLDGSLTPAVDDDEPIQATIFCILIVLLVIAGQFELARLAAARGLKIFTPITIVSSILFATSSYWQQFVEVDTALYLSLLLSLSLLSMFLYQYARHQTSGVIANCGASFFSIIYLGVLSSFVLAVRVEYGLWALLMLVFVVKCSDIGAYTFGRLFGKHKFSPSISPGKTWEGMAGAVAVAVIVAVLFAVNCGIMAWQAAIVFGFCFAFIAQLGDLAESMIKRDCQQKDSSGSVPGFGGLLDVIDSPLIAAMFGYLFFMYVGP